MCIIIIIIFIRKKVNNRFYDHTSHTSNNLLLISYRWKVFGYDKAKKKNGGWGIEGLRTENDFKIKKLPVKIFFVPYVKLVACVYVLKCL